MQKRSSYNLGNFDWAYKIDKQASDMQDNRHCHDAYEILYIVDGTGTLTVEGTQFDIIPGTLVVIRPLEYHSMTIADGAVYERYIIHFERENLIDDAVRILDDLMAVTEGSGRTYPPSTVSENIMPLLERFEGAQSLPENERAMYIRMLLSELMIFLSLSNGEDISHNEAELGARVIRYLNENITKNISLDRLARRFFVSKFYLCRAFKKHNGISVHGYINRKRVMYAKQLIESGETASGAAYKVGFGDYSAFYRAYVKVVGKSPTA